MKKQVVLMAAILTFAGNLRAQRPADWSTQLAGEANQIFFHSLTGVPIVQGNDYYAGIDVQNHSVKWTVKRSGMQALAAVTGNDEGQDFFEIANSPFAVANNTLLDTRDGKVILEKEKDGFKAIVDYELLPAINAILVRTNSADGFVKLHLIDKKTGTQKWGNNIVKTSSSFADALGKGKATQVIVPIGTTPLVQNNQFIIFQYKKEIALVNVADGKVSWNGKLDPARIFFSADEKIAFIVEHNKGGLIAQALTVGGKRMGKEITAIDVATGKEVWKKPIEADEQIKWYDVRGDQILVVHAKGCNFYSIADGKKVWKDEFEGKKIAKLEENTEGYLVSYGYKKTMQLDKNGKKLWKKPKTTANEDDDVDDEADFVAFKYEKGNVFLTTTRLSFSPTKASGMKKFSIGIKPETKLEYDKARKTLLVFEGNEVSLVNPDKFAKGFIEKKTKTDSKDIQFVEMRADCYYFSGQEDFIILKPEGEVVERHYKEPFDGKAFFASALSTSMALGGAYMQVAGQTNMMMGSGDAVSGALTGSDDQLDKGGKNIDKGASQYNTGAAMAEAASFMPSARHTAFSQTHNFAYFFTKDKKSSEKVLVKLNKDTGEEVDKLVLNDARPLYKVDEVEDRVIYANKKELKVFEAKK